MRMIRKTLSAVTLLIVWVVAMTILWGWIFTFITDDAPEKKLVVFADARMPHAYQLAGALEKELPEGIRLIQVHAFDYAMFGDNSIQTADIYIIPEADLSLYSAWFRPLPEGMKADTGDWGLTVPADCLVSRYIEDETGTPFYLVFGAASRHVPGNEGAADDAAVILAERLLGND